MDLASFIAGPGAAVILSDFGADVIKVEPPTGDTWRIGYKIPPQPRAKDNYPWHLNNRNKRGLALDLKSPQAAADSRAAGQVGRRADRQHAASGAQEAQAGVRGRGAVESAAHLCRRHRLWRQGPGCSAPGIRYHLLLGPERPAVDDAGRGRAADAAGGGQRRSRHRRRTLSARSSPALYRRERTGKGSYVTTSLLASGVWAAGVVVQAALATRRSTRCTIG